MPKYVVTHWNKMTKQTKEILANSPREAVIKAGYSSHELLGQRESRAINQGWKDEKDNYFAGINEIYAIEYECDFEKLPTYFYEMFDNKNFGVYSFNIVGSDKVINYYEVKVDNISKFIHPLMVGRLLNENEQSKTKIENYGDNSVEVFCNKISILNLT